MLEIKKNIVKLALNQVITQIQKVLKTLIFQVFYLLPVKNCASLLLF